MILLDNHCAGIRPQAGTFRPYGPEAGVDGFQSGNGCPVHHPGRYQDAGKYALDTIFTRLAYDTSGMLPVVRQTVAYLKGSGISPSRFWAYALVQEMRRVLTEIWAKNWKISRTSSEGFRGEVCSYSFFSIFW